MLSLLTYLLVFALIPGCIEVDLSVPSFPDMVRYFGVTEGKIQFTLAINFLGACLSAFFMGPLSDTWGRRPVMVYGNALMVLGAVGCVYASSIEWLYVSRFFQGMGSSAAAVIVFAMVADVYQGKKAATMIALMNAVITIFMALAPVVGSFLNQSVGWKGSYAVVAIFSFIVWCFLVILLPETKKNFDKFDVNKMKQDFKRLLCCPIFQCASILPSLLYSAYFAYISCASFLYIETLKVSIGEYALNQAVVVGSFSVVSLLSGRLMQKLGKSGMAHTGIFLTCFSVLGLIGATFYGRYTPTIITNLMVLFGIGFAAVYPVIFSASLEIYPDIKGTVSSMLMTIRLLVCAATLSLVSVLYDGTLMAMTIVLTLCTTIAGFAYLFLLKQKRKDKFNIRETLL